MLFSVLDAECVLYVPVNGIISVCSKLLGYKSANYGSIITCIF